MKKIKKFLIVFLALFLLVVAFRVGMSTYENIMRQNNESKTLLNQIITFEEAEELCYSVVGKQDKDTGFLFSFGYTETIVKDGKEYYAIRASWLVNNSHMSYIGDYFVSVDGKEIYTGYANNGEYEFDKLILSK